MHTRTCIGAVCNLASILPMTHDEAPSHACSLKPFLSLQSHASKRHSTVMISPGNLSELQHVAEQEESTLDSIQRDAEHVCMCMCVYVCVCVCDGSAIDKYCNLCCYNKGRKLMADQLGVCY
jgi:hypothetical protein